MSDALRNCAQLLADSPLSCASLSAAHDADTNQATYVVAGLADSRDPVTAETIASH